MDLADSILRVKRDALNGNPEAIKALLKIQKALASAESVKMIV